MLIKEYRVTLPITVEEYQVAQLYCVAELSKTETGGGEGIEVLKNEPFKDYPLLGPNAKTYTPLTPKELEQTLKIDTNAQTSTASALQLEIDNNCNVCPGCVMSGGKFSSGQYTYKIYHLASKVPAFIKLMAPKGSLEIHEEAWNAYPYCRTVLTNPGYMKGNFVICIESFHLPDAGDQYNVHELPPEKLKDREVVTIDIANDPIASSDYKPEYDPQKFKSKKTERGPLQGNWRTQVKPVMTCYKLVTSEFKWFGLQSKVENVIHKSERRLFTIFHRQVFCTMDDWYGMTMADIRAIEDRTKEELERLRREGEVRGMRAENE